MNNSIKVYALHGFLGLPGDWQMLQLQNSFEAIDLYAEELAHPRLGLAAWAASLNAQAAQDPSPKLLLGYSLGGRLAMHTLLDRPDLWQAAVIVSAHPGGLTGEERQVRRGRDAAWRERFLNEPWPSLIDSWNGQEVLNRSSCLPRFEQLYDRCRLAESLIGWSLASQADLRSGLEELSLPLLWLNGENDHGYCRIAKTLHFRHSRSKKSIVSNSGHRLPWDNSIEFRSELENFMRGLHDADGK